MFFVSPMIKERCIIFVSNLLIVALFVLLNIPERPVRPGHALPDIHIPQPQLLLALFIGIKLRLRLRQREGQRQALALGLPGSQRNLPGL